MTGQGQNDFANPLCVLGPGLKEQELQESFACGNNRDTSMHEYMLCCANRF